LQTFLSGSGSNTSSAAGEQASSDGIGSRAKRGRKRQFEFTPLTYTCLGDGIKKQPEAARLPDGQVSNEES
jgi:hypothetical protein